ncbi:hypothetical protein TNCV_3502991 [Trichonephila clavipes]|uniref:Uncharacterized protein n=1 Tax=Trichonephila clavipes TaxID=2585209 RepID=A0A8X6S8H7_TRICX|nr:hypothetical protein TNCV_3502991 [Trichonephila clavipes]
MWYSCCCRVLFEGKLTEPETGWISRYTCVVGRSLSTIQVRERFHSVPLQFRERTPWMWSGASHLSSISTHLVRGLVAHRHLRVPPAGKALFIYKHPCLLRDSNPGPTTQQSASLTTILDG